MTYASRYGPVLNYMDAIDALPYLRGHSGKDMAIGKYRTGDVLLFVNTMRQKAAFHGLVQRTHAKAVEAKMKRK